MRGERRPSGVGQRACAVPGGYGRPSRRSRGLVARPVHLTLERPPCCPPWNVVSVAVSDLFSVRPRSPKWRPISAGPPPPRDHGPTRASTSPRASWTWRPCGVIRTSRARRSTAQRSRKLRTRSVAMACSSRSASAALATGTRSSPGSVGGAQRKRRARQDPGGRSRRHLRRDQPRAGDRRERPAAGPGSPREGARLPGAHGASGLDPGAGGRACRHRPRLRDEPPANPRPPLRGAGGPRRRDDLHGPCEGPARHQAQESRTGSPREGRPW